MTYQVRELLLPDGSSPYANWLISLDAQAAAKVTVAVARLEQGNTSNIKWFRGIGELKIDWGPGYRIYLGKKEQKVFLLVGGGTKKGQQVDIENAISRWEAHRQNKMEKSAKR